jgi:beta-galactosidase/beta-glucuronidase
MRQNNRIRLVLSIICLIVGAVGAAAQTAPVPRPEHPNPIFTRADWQTLNGRWEFEFDDQNRGVAERWYGASGKRFSRTIIVPYCFQSRLSGIGDTSFHDVVWYRRTVNISDGFRKGRQIVLHFGAVDYQATVWVNGEHAGSHRGGNVGFAVDLTDYLKSGDNVIVVRAFDPSTDMSLPRGKQYWKQKSEAIWYTRTTGIWQPVWLEAVNATRIKNFRVTPDVDNAQATVEVILTALVPDLKLRATARFQNNPLAQIEIICTNLRPTTTMKLNDSFERQALWSPERPNLYDLTLELVNGRGETLDRVESYFGQRKISVHDGKIYLNNRPYYLKQVLDQGYWPESILTPPSEEAIIYDIKMTKAFGFNGARKHQKVEDPRWLYQADKMGLIVWGEMANAYDYSEEYVSRFTDEWQQVIARDYNHPSIIAWVPINESWGIHHILTNKAQQEHAKTMYHLTRSLDQTRLVIDNDGWEHTDETDLMTLHDYARTGEEMAAKYKALGAPENGRVRIPRNGREALAYGYQYNGTPFLMTEFGGIAYRAGTQVADNEWGYSGIEPNKEALLRRLDGLVKALHGNPVFAGYCYTQLTDVEQEINGLMTYDRKPKATPEEYAKIFNQR